MKKINVMDRVYAANEEWAEANRNLLKENGSVMLNLIGSPGAGKTALIEQTIPRVSDFRSPAVIEGDLATSRDADRVRKTGAPAYQINTGSGCHLNARLVNTALLDLYKKGGHDLIFVENVGNLVCPAEFDIGEHAKIAVLSVAEGDDKIEKYPLLFARASALVVTKIDLLAHTDFRTEKVKRDYERLNKRGRTFIVDNLRGDGFDGWIEFLKRL